MKIVIIASTNPVKVNASEIGFSKMFPDEIFEFRGLMAESGVSHQPMNNDETLTGAINRTNNASKLAPQADFWVGIEGGVELMDDEMEVFAWVVIKSKSGLVGKGKTGSFLLPKKIIKLIQEGKELGEADDIAFSRTNSKQSNGTVGLLTKDVITRITYYETAVILALIPFKNSTLY